MRFGATIRREGTLLDYTGKSEVRLHSSLGNEREERGLPAGIKTTGHSRPFAAWTVMIVTFCHSSHQDYPLICMEVLKHKLTGVEASS